MMLRINKFLIALALATLLLPAQPVTATTFTGQNGRIAFSKTNGELWTIRQNGTHARSLNIHNASDATWSPNGAYLAFVTPRSNGNKRLQIVHISTGVTRSITHQMNVSDSSPAWSPDGTHIAFVRTKQKPNRVLSAVHTVRLANHAIKNISGWSMDQAYRTPAWAPDGKRLAYEEAGKNTGRILIKNLLNGHTRELTGISNVTASPLVAWSPSGEKILFNDSEGQIYTIWTDGTHRTVISDGDSYAASWSPDGERIAFLEDFSGEYISISEPDGTIRYIPLALAGYTSIGAPVWSPDGKQLALTATHTMTHQQDLFLITLASGTSPKKIAANVIDGPAWQAVHPIK